jgi:hypothetical protein
MTDDILARLRQTHRIGCDCVGCEAADEIERLRNALVDSEREVMMLTRGMRMIIDNAQNEPLAADYARSLLEGRQTNLKAGSG